MLLVLKSIHILQKHFCSLSTHTPFAASATAHKDVDKAGARSMALLSAPTCAFKQSLFRARCAFRGQAFGLGRPCGADKRLIPYDNVPYAARARILVHTQRRSLIALSNSGHSSHSGVAPLLASIVHFYCSLRASFPQIREDKRSFWWCRCGGLDTILKDHRQSL